MAAKAHGGRKGAGLSFHEANLRIARLRRQAVETQCGAEDLDRPLDEGFEVTGDERAHKIVLKVGDVGVSWCAVVDFQQQIGKSLVRMGGLADVGTHNDHRFKGYSRRVQINSLRWMRQAGYDVAMLYGIPGFYPKFGYAEAFPGVTHSIMVRDAELAQGGGLRFVEFDERRHLAAVLKMYHETNAGRTGPTVRQEGKWIVFRRGNAWGPLPVVKVGLDGRGGAVCYYVCDGAPNVEATVLEAGYASPAVFAPLLREMAAMAWGGRVEKVTFQMPEDDAFMAFCRQFGMRKETHYRRDGGAMVRMINVAGAMRNIAPVVEDRMAGAGKGRVTLRTNLDSVAISWGGRGGIVVENLTGRGSRGGTEPHRALSKGEQRVARPTGTSRQSGIVSLPQWALAQLLYGYGSVESLATGGLVSGQEAGLAALARMFPPGPHFHYRVDAF